MRQVSLEVECLEGEPVVGKLWGAVEVVLRFEEEGVFYVGPYV